MNYKLILIIALTVLCQACVVGPQYTPLTQETKASVKQVELYNLVLQDEVKPAVRLSNVTGALGGGLIGVVIDSNVNKGRSNTAQDIIKPLYDITEDYDYRKVIAETYNRSVANELPIKSNKEIAETILFTNKELLKKIKSLKDGEALLYLSSFYLFLNESKLLTTETLAFLYTNNSNGKKPSSKAIPKPIFFNNFTYESKPTGNGNEDSIALWSKNNGELFRETLQEGLDFISKKLNYELQANLNEHCFIKVKSTFASQLNINTRLSGTLVEAKDGRNTIRSSRGFLISTERPYTIVKQKKSKDCE